MFHFLCCCIKGTLDNVSIRKKADESRNDWQGKWKIKNTDTMVTRGETSRKGGGHSCMLERKLKLFTLACRLILNISVMFFLYLYAKLTSCYYTLLLCILLRAISTIPLTAVLALSVVCLPLEVSASIDIAFLCWYWLKAYAMSMSYHNFMSTSLICLTHCHQRAT